ncbi:MAG: lysostaphin resistance A-like protein [Terriglobales bacterium]
MSIDAKSGLKAAGIWTLVEFAIRVGLIAVAGGGLALSGNLPEGSALPGTFVGMALAVPLAIAAVVLTAIFWRRATREGLGPRDLGYHISRHRVLAGVASGLFLHLLLGWGTARIDLALFPDAAKAAELLMRLIASGGPVVLASMLLANGILGPIVEEFAWRGYVQYRLTRAWGTWAGLAVTALLFAAKHMVVDLSFGRTLTLLVGACVLGLIRWRWGTAASTVAHVTLNLFGTWYVLATAAGS